MKIGVVTFWGANYGAILQCYALQQVLKSLGHEVKTINKGWGKYSLPPTLKQKIKDMLFSDVFKQFKKKYIEFTPLIKNEKELLELNNQFEAIIVGSDQIWNSDCIKDMGFYYYLDWVKSSVKKYAYAVSFGKDTFDTTQSNIADISILLNSYQKISVREDSGVEICQDTLNVNAIHLLDPTFLLSQEHYNRLIGDVKIGKLYICKYFLDSTECKDKLVDRIAAETHLAIIDNYPSKINKYKGWISSKYRYPSIREWLQNIRSADYVVTDSFHGMVFSLIYHKKFICINNKKRGSTRFQSLLGALDLSYRLVDVEEIDFVKNMNILQTSIDYAIVDQKLAEQQKSSLRFLETL